MWFKSSSHHGDAARTVRQLLGELLQSDPKACGFPVILAGSAGDRLPEVCPGLSALGDVPAIHRGVRVLAPDARSVIEIGSQSARFLTGLDRDTKAAVLEYLKAHTKGRTLLLVTHDPAERDALAQHVLDMTPAV